MMKALFTFSLPYRMINLNPGVRDAPFIRETACNSALIPITMPVRVNTTAMITSMAQLTADFPGAGSLLTAAKKTRSMRIW